MTQKEEDNICDEALNLIEAKYSKEQRVELKMIHDLRATIAEFKMECCV